MIRKASDVQSLLAARVRTPRRAPRQAERPGPPRLRLVDEAPVGRGSAGAPGSSCDAAASAIETAATALSQIQVLLSDLSALCAPQKKRPRRRSPREMAALQRCIDAVLRTIEDIAASTTFGRVRLLSGRWQPVVPGGEQAEVTAPAIPSMHVERLADPPRRSLAAIGSGRAYCLAAVPFAEVYRIVEQARLQVGLQLRLLQRLSDRGDDGPIAGGSDAVIEENESAAQQATHDPVFAELTSRITRGDLVVQKQGAPAFLRIVSAPNDHDS